MGIPFTAIHGSIRFSLSRYTTEQEIDEVIKTVPPIINELRLLSPFGRDKLDKSILCKP
jgi:cysteine desulfurase